MMEFPEVTALEMLIGFLSLGIGFVLCIIAVCILIALIDMQLSRSKEAKKMIKKKKSLYY